MVNKHCYTRKLTKAWKDYCDEIKEIESNLSQASATLNGHSRTPQQVPLTHIGVSNGGIWSQGSAASPHAFMPHAKSGSKPTASVRKDSKSSKH